MGCLSHRKKQTAIFVDQKWDYINLNDFKSKGCGAGFAYGYLWFSLILSIAVYVVDTFTAVQLLVFNRWSSKIEPAISFAISKWIFSVCILLSFANLAFEGIRATRVISRGNIAECYMDSLAVRWESARLGSGQGWKRFLVFTELTKSKKGSHYVALFTYFNFQAWIRIIFCMGPRQVVNALTLRSVYMAKLAVNSKTVGGSITGFFDNIGLLAREDFRQAAILSGMLFTLVIWIFSALYLITAVFFYILFLFHWIPKSDGGLTAYCERKINKALLRIVTKHVNKALARGQADRLKAAMSSEKVYHHPDTSVPTLPNVGIPSMLERSATLPPEYTSRPATPGDGHKGMDWERPIYSRTGTGASQSRYSSRAPLVKSAAEMGYDGSDSRSTKDQGLSRPPPTRSTTINSHSSSGSRPGTGHARVESGSMLRQAITQSPTLMDSERMPAFVPARQYGGYGSSSRSSVAPSHISYQPRQLTRSATSQVPLPDPQPLQRTMTAPMPSHNTPANNHYRRTETQNMQQPHPNFSRHPSVTRNPFSSYGYDVEAQNNRRPQW
ncbi:Low affinity K(+) transporter 1 [Cladobotryum mycophilum]|uniref:Low affinity K(+) transporter 1 n=1 Tax=Cladobotryum mycophilum TaxID=491253 RepID=A0ABR0S6X0_9HYPO